MLTTDTVKVAIFNQVCQASAGTMSKSPVPIKIMKSFFAKFHFTVSGEKSKRGVPVEEL